MEALEICNEKLQELLESADLITEQVDKTMSAIQEENEGFLNTKWISDDFELMDHQVTGVNWLQALHARGLNGILADEMGLGKTLQVIALFGELFASHNMRGPHLVVMPLSVISSWRNDIARFLADDQSANVYVHHGEKEEREANLHSWWREVRRVIRHKGKSKWKVAWVLTTYDMIIKDVHYLKKFEGWQYLVVDEAHRLKNRSAVLFGALNKITTQHRLLLTGTPLQNNLNDLWSLLSFMLPKLFSDMQQFNDWFNKPFESNDTAESNLATISHSRTKKSQNFCFTNQSASTLVNGLNLSVSSVLSDSESSAIITSLHRAIKPFLLRRLKSEVAPDLPSKFERIVYCPLSDLQLAMYKMFKELAEKKETLKSSQYAAFDDTLTLELRRMVKPLTSFTNMIVQLRKLCNHPFLILEDMKTIPDDQYFAHLMSSSGKMIVLERILNQLLSRGSKVLIFSQMTSALNLIESFLHQSGIEYFRLDGNTRQEDRQHSLKEFNSPNCTVPVFLLSTRAGGVGINLQAADTVILFDSDWNPQMDLQAISRTHRIGQTKKVLILRLISTGPDDAIHSIEQKIIARAHRKLLASRAVLAEGVFDMGGGASGANGGGSSSSSSDNTTSSDCSSVLECPIKSTHSNRSLNVEEGEYGLDDEYNCFDEANMDADTGDWYIGLDRSTTMRSLFEVNGGDDKKNAPIKLEEQFSVNCGDDHFLSLYDSMDFSAKGIKRICTRDTDERDEGLQSANEEYCPLVHNNMESIGPIDVSWKSWLGNGIQYSEEDQPTKEELRQRILGKRKARGTSLYATKNDERLDESELDALLGESDGSPASRKRTSQSPTKRQQAKAKNDVDEDYIEATVQTNQRRVSKPVIRFQAGLIADNYLYGEDLDRSCSLKAKGCRLPAYSTKKDVLFFPSEDVCVICSHAWVSEDAMAQYTNEVEQEGGDVAAVAELEEVMLICEGCEGSYHLICTGMKSVPEDNWYCQWCTDCDD